MSLHRRDPLDPPARHPAIKTIGLLYETEADLMAIPSAQPETHYHWREPEEVKAVATTLTALGYEVQEIGAIASLFACWQRKQLPDFIWNLSVRAQSRNRTAIAPALLESLGIPYTGADAAVKSLTLNKDWLKPVLHWLNIPTPPWYRYASMDAVTTLPAWSVSILKPTCEGYSLGLTQFDNRQGLTHLQQLVAQLCQSFQGPVICEPLIVGREITVGLVGNTTPLLLGAVETVDRDHQQMGDRILTLQTKRSGGFHKVELNLDTPAFHPLKTAVLTLMSLFKPLDYATFDFRVAPDGQPFLLDINADATLHPQRSLAQIAQRSDLTYHDLIALILQASLVRWEGLNR